ncbi:MAG: hypothetical protein HPY50_14630 [Firmicutes bacterium]|nr:hypothetical protein [Bacillota bacterium]
MTVPLIDERHQELRWIVQMVALICLSDEFNSLRKELESLYLKNGNEPASVLAFQDALYTLMAQEEVDFRRARAY